MQWSFSGASIPLQIFHKNHLSSALTSAFVFLILQQAGRISGNSAPRIFSSSGMWLNWSPIFNNGKSLKALGQLLV
ncbi:hypothetical protein XELAEV_18018313mg [Xenopus laevis]|uniref:Uncharacterized protein n=1 Tax=Xenopus laevis TaxID=8355 RepID=A0A974DCR4_XENLA|nr:hypothetical protein XELAEV_18018313mg [Xenopus laevis]